MTITRHRLAVIGLVSLLSSGGAAAQNNSLLRGGVQTGPATKAPQPAPVSQPGATRPVRLEASAAVVAARRLPTPETQAQNATLQHVSPFAVAAPEPRVFAVHDLLTIIVREAKTQKTDAKLESDKEWEVSSALEKFFRLNGRHQLIPQTFEEGTPGVEFDFESEYAGKGKSDRQDSFTTRITAKIVDVKPNGNLVIEASDRVRLDEEEYVVTLTGVCRSNDVTAQNTILSTQLYQKEIDVNATGAVKDATRRGWLMRVFDIIRPI